MHMYAGTPVNIQNRSVLYANRGGTRCAVLLTSMALDSIFGRASALGLLITNQWSTFKLN